MCRLLGVASLAPVSIAAAVGEAVLTDFVALTKIHGDGWGVAGVDRPGDTPWITVSAGTALGDRDFDAATHDLTPRASLVHLRWATNGLAIEPRNSHPFLADGLAMAHNGSIKPVGALDDLLDPATASTVRGTTDSERYFALIRRHRRTASTLAEAVRAAVAQLRGGHPDASLNALLLGEEQLVVVHAHAHSRLLDEDVEEISATDLPAEHLEDYFALRIARPAPGVVVVGSTGFGDLEWEALPPESVISVSLRDLSTTILPLAEAAHP